MEKALVLGLLGLALGTGSSYGQGYILLDNYNSAVFPLVTYGAGVPIDGICGSLGTTGAALAGDNSSWTVGIYFVGGTQNPIDPPGSNVPIAPFSLGTGPGATVLVGNLNTSGAPGMFAAGLLFYTGSAANTTITAEIVAYDTAGGSYANALYRGHSAPFNMPTGLIGDAVPKYVGDYFTTFSVTGVPEPTTLALTGSGGLALLLFRRKTA